jgi:hypothetical protein
MFWLILPLYRILLAVLISLYWRSADICICSPSSHNDLLYQSSALAASKQCWSIVTSQLSASNKTWRRVLLASTLVLCTLVWLLNSTIWNNILTPLLHSSVRIWAWCVTHMVSQRWLNCGFPRDNSLCATLWPTRSLFYLFFCLNVNTLFIASRSSRTDLCIGRISEARLTLPYGQFRTFRSI